MPIDSLGIVFSAQLDQTGLLSLFDQRLDGIVEEQLVGIVLGEDTPALVQVKLGRVGGTLNVKRDM